MRKQKAVSAIVKKNFFTEINHSFELAFFSESSEPVNKI